MICQKCCIDKPITSFPKFFCMTSNQFEHYKSCHSCRCNYVKTKDKIPNEIVENIIKKINDKVLLATIASEHNLKYKQVYYLCRKYNLEVPKRNKQNE